MTSLGLLARRRASLVLAGAVALSVTGCSLVGGDDEPTATGSTHVPLTTTTTTEPTPSSSSSSGKGSSVTDLPDPTTLLNSARDYMAVSNNVTISGTLHESKKGIDVKIHAEGSTGGVKTSNEHAGISKTTLSVDGGGKLEVIIIGWDHYVKANEAWLEAVEAPRDSPMRKHTDTWIKVPAENSDVAQYKPNQLLKRTFFGQALTPFDKKRSTVSVDQDPIDDQEVYRVVLRKAGKSSSADRIVWISTDPDAAQTLKLTYGQYPSRTTLTYSKWNSSREDFTKPAKYKTVEDVNAGDL